MRLAPFVMGLGVTWPADDFGTVDKWPADDFDYTSFGQEVEALQAHLVKVSQANEVLPELLQECKRLTALLESMRALINQPHFALHYARSGIERLLSCARYT